MEEEKEDKKDMDNEKEQVKDKKNMILEMN